jgi:hypothetical protein
MERKPNPYVTDQQTMAEVLSDSTIVKDEYNLVEILKVPIHKKLGGLISLHHMINEPSLNEQFLAVEKTHNCIPLVDARETIMLQLDSNLLTNANIRKKEFKKMTDMGVTEAEATTIWKECERQCEQNKELAHANNQQYKMPKTFVFQWVKPNNLQKPRKTIADKTGRVIYSLSGQIPVNKELKEQYSFFQVILDMMIDALFFTEREGEKPIITVDKNSIVYYGYFISNNIKLNVFLSVH